VKVLFVNPPWQDADRVGFRSNVRWPFTVSRDQLADTGAASYHFPIYQAYGLAVLEQDGHEVAAVDCTALDLDVSDLLGRMADFAPDLIVVEVSTPSFPVDIETIRRMDEQNDVPLVLIGAHASVFHREILTEHLFVDAIARGEYEYTLRDAARALEEGRPFAGVAGLTCRDSDGETVVGPDRPYIYHEPGYIALPWITMVSTRGCPSKCTFCNWPQTMYGHTYRARSAENVVDEMAYCVGKYHPGEIFFDDDTFTIGKKRVLEICSEIERRGLDVLWTCMGRVDTVDTEVLSRMRSAGCRKIKFGVETGSREVMDRIRKRIDLQRVPEVFRAARDAGIEVHGTFMVGLPGETRETVRETIELACSLPMDTVQFSIATPFPGTEFFAECERNGWLVTRDWSHYDGRFGAVVSYPQLDKTEIELMLTLAEREYLDRTQRRSLLSKFIDTTRHHGLRYALGKTREYLRTRTQRG